MSELHPCNDEVGIESVPEAYVVHAGALRRFAALSIDGAVIAPLLLLTIAIAGPDARASPATFNPFDDMWRDGMLAAAMLIGYFSLTQGRPAVASMGKRAVGIKVVRSNGQPMSLTRSIGRASFLLACNVVLLGVGYGLLCLAMAMSGRKQWPHDRLFGTMVVDRYAFTGEHARQQAGVDVVTAAVLTIVIGFVVLVLGPTAIMVIRA